MISDLGFMNQESPVENFAADTARSVRRTLRPYTFTAASRWCANAIA